MAESSPAAYAAASVTITDLTDEPTDYDNKEVVFSGEAIGDILRAHDGYVWVTLTDHENAGIVTDTGDPSDIARTSFDINASISVLMTNEQAALITNLGRYRVEGTTLEITGSFYLACEEHQGQSDVHATSVKVVTPGGKLSQSPRISLLIVGIVLICVGVALTFLFRVLRNRQR